MQFVTDFADEAVILPVAIMVLAVFLATGWRRGALAWAAGVGSVLGVMLVLKIVVFACGHLLPWVGLASPSGHTAASAVVYGGILAFVAPESRRAAVVAACWGGAVALLIALTRLGLGVHTLADVIVGAGVGVVGAVAMRMLAGRKPAVLPAPWLLVAVVAAMAVFHGSRLEAETRIRWAAVDLWPLSICREDPAFKSMRARTIEGDPAHGDTMQLKHRAA